MPDKISAATGGAVSSPPRGDDVDVVIPVVDGYGASDTRLIKTSERRLTDAR